MRTVGRRLARLERASEPPTRYMTLKDLILASMGEPIPQGQVWGGPLARAFGELHRLQKDEQPRSAHYSLGART